MKIYWYKTRMPLPLIMVVLFTLPFLTSKSNQAHNNFEQIVWPDLGLQMLVDELDHPVYITHAGDGSLRLFIVEQAGQVQIIENNQLLPTPFLDIRDRVRSPWSSDPGGSEEGLLSIAFPENFTQTNTFYVYYTNLEGNNLVARYSVTSDVNVADPNSEYGVLELEHPRHQNHNGGQLAFGLDDYLYIGTGDGGGAGDPEENAQDPSSLLGKLLRIDVQDPGVPYTIPATNPFTQTLGYRGEIWALGLRNPWRYSFDRLSGDLFIGDVGQNRIEEIDFQPFSSTGGENYGWDILEGSSCFEPLSECTPPENNVFPIVEYEHGQNDSLGCSVTGGYVYRGILHPQMNGIYFFADFCVGTIWGSQREQEIWITTPLWDSDQAHNFSSFGEDEQGNLYIADHSNGIIFHLFDRTDWHHYHIPFIIR